MSRRDPAETGCGADQALCETAGLFGRLAPCFCATSFAARMARSTAIGASSKTAESRAGGRSSGTCFIWARSTTASAPHGAGRSRRSMRAGCASQGRGNIATPRAGVRFAAVLRFNIGVPPPLDPDALSPTQLKELVVQLLAEVAALKQMVAAQREEIARLKGLKGPPSIKPSGMERSTAASSSKPGGDKPSRGKVRPCVSERRGAHRHHHRPTRLQRFKGYGRGFLVQDLHYLSVQAIHLPARALGFARWPDHPRAIAGGHRRCLFRP